MANYRNGSAYRSNLTYRVVLEPSKFGHYDEPYYAYDAPEQIYDASLLVLQTLGIMARIIPVQTKTLEIRAPISAPAQHQALTARARIKALPQIQSGGRVAPTLYARCRVSRQQGWPIIEAGARGSESFVATQLYAKASVLRPVFVAGQTTLSIKARIKPLRQQALELGAHLVPGQSMQSRAWILPVSSRSQVPCTFNVRQVAQRRATMIFYTQGFQEMVSCQVGAYIVPCMSKRVTGHFLVKAPAQTGPIMWIMNPQATVSKQQSIGIQARVGT